MNRFLSVTLAVASLLQAREALAQPAAEEPAKREETRLVQSSPEMSASTRSAPSAVPDADRSAAAPAPPPERFRVNAGLRVSYPSTTGFDQFGDVNTLPQFSIDGTYAFHRSGRLALAAGLGWDVGGRTGTLRTLETSLTVHRFLVPIEARYDVTSWVWAFGKIAPGAALVLTAVDEPSAPDTLKGSGWAFAADLSVGTTFVVGRRKPGKTTPRFLLTPEIGYSLTTAAPATLETGRAEENTLGTDEATRLDPVALGGIFWRASVGIAF